MAIINPYAQTTAQMAQALINTRSIPQGHAAMREESDRARAYHKLKPYPRWAYRDWKTEDRGPLPRCMPLPRRAVRRAARFLFGKGIEIKCAGNGVLETFLRDAWTGNRMPARAVPLAETGALDGGVVLKFAYDPDAATPLSIQTLSLVNEVRLFFHPHDRARLLMGRVQYPYFDAAQNATFWHREEWTAEQFITYNPIKADALGQTDPDTYENWIVALKQPNPFGLIPLTHVKNLETDNVYGIGDLWELWEVIDDLNLVWYQMRRSNQFDSEITPHYIDADLDDEDIDKPLAPGQAADIRTVEGAQQQAKVLFPTGGNSLRPAMMEYASELRKQIEEAAGTVSIDQAEVTNKGNLTRAVLVQIYQILLETNAEKQKSYGQNGIELFLEACALGLQKNGVALGVNPADPDSFNVEIAWPAAFELSEEEKTAIVGRVQEEEMAGYTTHERAVDTVAQMEGVRDIPTLKEELKREPRPTPTETDPNAPTDKPAVNAP